MKIIEKNGLRILEPKNGKFIARKDKSDVFEASLYLGKFDSENNYIEVTQSERDEIIKTKEEKR